jgi:hypothetical protein
MAGSTVLPRQSAGPTLLNTAAGEGQRQLSCSVDFGASFSACHRCQGVRQGIPSSSTSLHGRQMLGPPLQNSLNRAHLCPNNQGQLYDATQVRCSACSPECCSQWEARTALLLSYPQYQLFQDVQFCTAPQTSPCPWVASQTADVFGGNRLLLLHGHGLLLLHVALNGSTDQNLTMALGGITSYSDQAVPHYPQVSSSASLYCLHILLFLFLFHFFTTYLLHIVMPSVSGCLESPQECYALPVQCGTRKGTSQTYQSFLCCSSLVSLVRWQRRLLTDAFATTVALLDAFPIHW